MEFRLSKTVEGRVQCEFILAGKTATELVPNEATWDRRELFKYCERRLQALQDKFQRQRGLEYNNLDADLNKVFEVRNNVVVEKGSGRPVTEKGQV